MCKTEACWKVYSRLDEIHPDMCLACHLVGMQLISKSHLLFRSAKAGQTLTERHKFMSRRTDRGYQIFVLFMPKLLLK